MTLFITASQALRCVVLQEREVSPTYARQPEEVERENLTERGDEGSLETHLLLYRCTGLMHPARSRRIDGARNQNRLDEFGIHIGWRLTNEGESEWHCSDPTQ